MAAVAAYPNGFTTLKHDVLRVELNGGSLGFGGTLRQVRLKSVTRFEVKRQLQVCASAEKAVSAPPIQRSK